jgi:ATPases of the AAA+ class
VSDLITRLRTLRSEAANLNATLVDDLKPFFGPEKPMFRRLPDSDEQRRNVTTTCSCLMSLAICGKLIEGFKAIKKLNNDGEAKGFITEVFEHAVNSPWMSSGLEDLNAFSSFIVLRTAGILSESTEDPLTKNALGMVHSKFVWDDGQPREIGPKKTLKQIFKDKIKQAPGSFSVGAYDPTPAIAYWFADAAASLRIEISDRIYELMARWASREFARQVSLVAAEHDAMKDPVAMAAAACLCWRLRGLTVGREAELRDTLMSILPTEIEIKQAVLAGFKSQQRSGIWPKYFPLFNYGMGEAGSNYFFSFELLEVIFSEFEESNLLEDKLVLDGIEKAISWCKSNRLVYTTGDVIYKGWNSGGQITTLKEGKPESWTTAVIHMFLHKLQLALSWQIKRHILMKYDAASPEIINPDSTEWDDFIDSPIFLPDEETSVKTVIAEEILEQIKKPGKDMEVGESITERRSVLLFGPPGTAKTSLVRALADKIGWPLVELDPSNFIGEGLEQIYQQVETVFTDLNDLWGVVVFFDEMDALASKRTDTIDVTRQLLTTSMLPKLSKLHGDRRVLFFMATNHLKNFDSAIKRPGRFDLLLCLAPPKWSEKIKNLASFLKRNTSDEDIKHIGERLKALVVLEETIELLNLFTFADFKSLLEHITKPTPDGSRIDKITPEEFDELVSEWAHNFIALNDRESERAEFKDDLKESRRQ